MAPTLSSCYSPSCLSGHPLKTCYSPVCRTHTTYRHVKLLRGTSGLGLRIYGSDLKEGVRIGEITPMGAADQTGAIFPGDLIFSINGKNMARASHDEVVEQLSAVNEIDLVLIPGESIAQAGPAPPSIKRIASQRQSVHLSESFSHPPSLAGSLSNNSTGGSLPPSHRPVSSTPSAANAAVALPLPETPRGSSVNIAAPTEVHPSDTDSNDDGNLRRVTLVRSSVGYGMKIRSDPNIRGVRVSDLSPNGAAIQSGLIFVGDIIMEINGIPMLDAQHQDVVAALVERSYVTLLLQSGDSNFPPVAAVQRKRVRLLRQHTGLGLKIMVS